MPNKPNRGEVWWADLGLAAKYRPVLVLNVEYGDCDYALYTVVPHTATPRKSSFEVSINVPNLKEGAFNIQGLFALPPRAFDRYVASITPNQIIQIEERLRDWLGLRG